MPHLSHPTNVERFSRQIRFTEFGEEGQRRLGAATVAIVGCGALGSVQAQLLARAGVGTLRLIDRDYVEESNLQRQVLYTEEDARAALPKAEAARRQLSEANSGVEYEVFVTDLEPGNAEELLGGADVVLDGTDNFETRFLINDLCVRDGVPWVYGAAVGSYGITLPVLPGAHACFRCIYPEPPGGAQPTCETAGVFGPVTSMIASIQAMMAMRLLAGKAVDPKIVRADLWNGPIRESGTPARDPECPCCGAREFSFLEGTRRAPVSLCGRNAVQIHERTRPLDLAALGSQLRAAGEVRANEFALRFHDGTHDMTIFPDGRAIIRGTTDVGVARSVYSRYIGN